MYHLSIYQWLLSINQKSGSNRRICYLSLLWNWERICLNYWSFNLPDFVSCLRRQLHMLAWLMRSVAVMQAARGDQFTLPCLGSSCQLPAFCDSLSFFSPCHQAKIVHCRSTGEHLPPEPMPTALHYELPRVLQSNGEFFLWTQRPSDFTLEPNYS